MLTDIEKRCLLRHRSGKVAPLRGAEADANWLEFCLHLILDAGTMIWRHASNLSTRELTLKEDGSPVTEVESGIEMLARERLHVFNSKAFLVGEETGGAFTSSGLEVAIDPIDGTWGLLSAAGTYATTLAAFRDGEPFLGMVSNPSVGEIGYWTQGSGSRLIRLFGFEEADRANTLPLTQATDGPLLVNIHPGRKSGSIVEHLYSSWAAGEVQMVRSTGGSPAWSLLEAAKGHYTYVNAWASRPTEAYDLAAAASILRGAGGDITDLEGAPIDALRQAGPFVASTDSKTRDKVTAIVKLALKKA
jgi:fructose-1,6-bisphosphatase/inositol monophosphatase family enzyme